MKRLRTSVAAAFLLGGAVLLGAGDTATFVDLGFSPDGETYLFAQYGVRFNSLQPWAELFVVDVPRNDFAADGRMTYLHDTPIRAGQDGSGALYQIIARNTATVERYGVDFLVQGRPIFVSPTGTVAGETVTFRDFDTGASYRAVLNAQVTGTGEALASSFHIALERTGPEGTTTAYTVGTPELKRSQVESYRIRQVLKAPPGDSLIFVIEMRKRNGEDIDVRFMVEALKLP